MNNLLNKHVNILLANDKSCNGKLVEVSDKYIVIEHEEIKVAVLGKNRSTGLQYINLHFVITMVEYQPEQEEGGSPLIVRG